MLLRRAFYYWQFPAVILLPVWLIVGWSVFGGGNVLSFVVVGPVLFVALLAIAAIIYARRSVREAKAVSWIDVGLLAALHAAVVALGFFGASTGWFALFGFLAVVLALGGFWITLWEVFTEAKQRVTSAFDSFARAAQTPSAPPSPPKPDDGVIIVKEVRRSAKPGTEP